MGARSGFTFMEVVVAVAIVAAVAGFGIAMDAPSFVRSSLDAEREALLSILSSARSEAMANVGSSDHGVYISPGAYVIFEGSSYATRNAGKDKEFAATPGVSFGGPSEIVFRSLDAFVPAAGTVTIASGGRTVSITVNQEGMIE